MQKLRAPGYHDDATHRLLRKLKMEKLEAGEGPTPGGSVADIKRPKSPTGVTEFQEKDMTQAAECIVRIVGIGNWKEVIVRAMNVNGVLSDTGANSCMADTEDNLVQCHDIAPVSVGLALKSGETPIMHVCSCMGYMPLAREDGTTHMQPFFVNSAATDCILSPDTIARQSRDCVPWRQVGHVGDRPGTLDFFDILGLRVMHLQLLNTNGIYYADVWAPRMDEQSVYSLFTEYWIQVLDGERPEADTIQAWTRVADTQMVRPIARRMMTRGTKAPPWLPALIGDEEFTPLVNPLSQREFTKEEERQPMGSAPGTKTVPANENRRDKQSKPVHVAKGRPKVQRPITTAEQLESELWAVWLGFCG